MKLNRKKVTARKGRQKNTDKLQKKRVENLEEKKYSMIKLKETCLKLRKPRICGLNVY